VIMHVLKAIVLTLTLGVGGGLLAFLIVIMYVRH